MHIIAVVAQDALSQASHISPLQVELPMVAGGRSMLALIRWVWHEMLLLSHVVAALWTACMTQVTRAFEPAVLLGLKPKTVNLYLSSVRDFVSWTEHFRIAVTSLPELDHAMLSFAKATQMSRSKLERLFSAVEAVMPHVKGQLHYTHQVLRAWRRAQPPKHAIPMSWQIALAIAWWLANHNMPRVGALLLLQWAAGMRPSEILNVVRDDLFPTFLNRFSDGTGFIALGSKHGTKSGRPQTSAFYNSEPWGA